MALTRSFKDTVQARVARDPAFKQALLAEGLIDGDLETGKVSGCPSAGITPTPKQDDL